MIQENLVILVIATIFFFQLLNHFILTHTFNLFSSLLFNLKKNIHSFVCMHGTCILLQPTLHIFNCLSIETDIALAIPSILFSLGISLFLFG